MSATTSQPVRRTLRDLVLLTVLIGAFFGIMLGSRPLSVSGEGRCVETAQDVLTGYVTAPINGVKYAVRRCRHE